MATANPRGHARPLLHPGFVGAGAALLIAAVVTDYMYYSTSLWQWANFSAWLITGGLVFALIAAIFVLVDLALGRTGRIDWVHLMLLAAAALLSLVNVFVHSRDAWTSVVRQGILLSAVVTVLLLIVGIRGWDVTSVRTSSPGDRP